MFRLIICACLLIVLVKANPILKTCPGTYCDQNTHRNALADLSDIFIPTFTSLPDQITQYKRNEENDKIYKLFHDRVGNNPVALGVINNALRYNNEDISNHIRNSGNIPNIVNNYIFLPTDIKTENVLKPSNANLENSNESKNRCGSDKKNASKQSISKPCNKNDNMIKRVSKIQTVDSQKIFSKNECVLENTSEITTEIHEDNSKRTLKRSLEDKNKTKHHENIDNNLNQNKRMLNSSSFDDIHSHNKTIYLENKSTNKKRRKDKSKQSPNKILSEFTENKKTLTSSNKDINSTHKKYDSNLKHGSKLNKKNKIKNSGSNQKKYTKEQNQNIVNNNEISRKKSGHKGLNVQADDPSSVSNDFNDMYKYIDTLLSNYQLTNTNYNSGFPFDYNNFYQLSQPPTPWNNINTINNKIVPHKRRKLQRLHGKRLNKKRAKLKKNQKERKVDDKIKDLDINKNLSEDLTSGKNEKSVSVKDNILKDTNMTSLEELENNSTKVFEEHMRNNKSITEKSSHFNYYPSFIIGIDDTVPIIFEDGFIDDYYPNFTADNKALNMTLEDKIYNSDKYYYVSNYNFDLEDYIKKRKELAMHNKNTNIKLLFSEKATNGDVKMSEEDSDEVGRIIKFQSPPLLDNPDFRTRKIESHEKYEPYYYHNVFHDPDEDFNKYYSEKKEIVYPTSYSLKNNMKNKLCNEIDDSISKAKWKKVKDSNVETVYARSKLAKYGLVL